MFGAVHCTAVHSVCAGVHKIEIHTAASHRPNATPTKPHPALHLPPAAVPVGVGSEGSLTLRSREMDVLLQRGMAYTEELGLSWPQDREVTEEQVATV